jgi:O-antigen/teichoic acid export membrane protein
MNILRIKSTFNNSIIRRSVVFILISFFGFSANYFTHFYASNLLSDASFGVFYESIIIINLAFVPSILLGMYFTRYIAGVASSTRRKNEYVSFINLVQRKGGLILGTVLFTLLLIYLIFSIDTLFLFSIIALAVYSSYLVESTKIILEAENKILSTGVFLIVSLSFRFVFAIIFLIVGGTVWSGILGIAISGFIVFALFYFYLDIRNIISKEKKFIPEFIDSMLSKKLILFSTSFLLASLIMYIDVIFAYFVLTPDDLSVYTASSVLSKGLLLFTLPLTKVLYPVLASNNYAHNKNNSRHVVVKMVFLMSCISVSGVLILILFSEILTQGSISIKHINLDVYLSIVLSVIPLTLLRTLITISMANGNDKGPFILIIPLVSYAVYAGTKQHDILQFANDFVMFSFAIFIFYIIIYIFTSNNLNRITN